MIAIIDYDAGNTRSVMHALDRLGYSYILTSEASKILSADKVIFPGVGHARSAMDALTKRNLIDVIQNVYQPFLGICLGMQLMYEYSEEGETKTLGLIPGCIKVFKPSTFIKIPHMGWNNNRIIKENVLINESKEQTYFVHSFYAPINDFTIATCNHGLEFTSVVNVNNYYGVQFHPEKSGEFGEKILKNFLKL